jgi:TIR domain
MEKRISIFFSYAYEDEILREELEKHLGVLKRRGTIEVWSDRNISAGSDWATEINTHLNNADIILLLVSPAFITSDYCYSVEMQRAIERHARGEAYVLPIIIRPVDWHETPFAKLQVLPKDGKPVTRWSSMDEAFSNVAEGIRVVCAELLTRAKSPLTTPHKPGTFGPLPEHIYQLYEVFVKSGVPNVTFVERHDFTRLKLALAQPGRGVVIEGPSGVGKTTSLKKAIESLTSSQPSSKKDLRVDIPIIMLSARNPDHRKKLQVLTNWHDGIVVIDDFHRLDPSLREEVVDYLKYLADTEANARKLVIVGIPQSGQMLVDISFDVATRIEVFKWGKVKNDLILQMIEKGEKALNIEIDRRSEIVFAASGSLNVAQFLCFNVCQREEVLMTQEQPRSIQPNISEAISEALVDLSMKFGEPIRRFVAIGGHRDSTCLKLLEELARSDNGVLSLPALKDRRSDLDKNLEQFIQQNWMDKLCKEYPHFLNFLFFDPTTHILAIDDPQLIFYLSKMTFDTLATEVGKVDTSLERAASEKASTPTRDQIFISYSHKDKIWLVRLLTMLKPLEKQGLIKAWSDTRIQPGMKWREEIDKALASAKVAILLVSPDFLASDFIADNELPPLLEAAQKEGLAILWIAVSYSMYKVTEIAVYQAANNPAEPLDGLSPSRINRELVSIAEKIKEIMSGELPFFL